MADQDTTFIPTSTKITKSKSKKSEYLSKSFFLLGDQSTYGVDFLTDNKGAKYFKYPYKVLEFAKLANISPFLDPIDHTNGELATNNPQVVEKVKPPKSDKGTGEEKENPIKTLIEKALSKSTKQLALSGYYASRFGNSFLSTLFDGEGANIDKWKSTSPIQMAVGGSGKESTRANKNGKFVRYYSDKRLDPDTNYADITGYIDLKAWKDSPEAKSTLTEHFTSRLTEQSEIYGMPPSALIDQLSKYESADDYIQDQVTNSFQKSMHVTASGKSFVDTKKGQQRNRSKLEETLEANLKSTDASVFVTSVVNSGDETFLPDGLKFDFLDDKQGPSEILNYTSEKEDIIFMIKQFPRFIIGAEMGGSLGASTMTKDMLRVFFKVVILPIMESIEIAVNRSIDLVYPDSNLKVVFERWNTEDDMILAKVTDILVKANILTLGQGLDMARPDLAGQHATPNLYYSDVNKTQNTNPDNTVIEDTEEDTKDIDSDGAEIEKSWSRIAGNGSLKFRKR